MSTTNIENEETLASKLELYTVCGEFLCSVTSTNTNEVIHAYFTMRRGNLYL
jgi:hypothetical protein